VRSLDGAAYIFGRNSAGCLGVGTNGVKAKKFQKQSKEDTPAAEDVISEHAPRRITAASLPGGKPGETIDYAACARSHTLLVSGGQVYAAGANSVGQVCMIVFQLGDLAHVNSKVRNSCLPRDQRMG
jgi:hypothetical protein